MSAKASEPGVGQFTFTLTEQPGVEHAPSFDLPDSVDLDQPTNMSHIFRVISDHADLPFSYASVDAIEQVRPEHLERYLYVPPARALEADAVNVYRGVVFPSDEFLQVAHNPGGLAARAKAAADKANRERPIEERQSEDVARATSRRAAGHALTGKVDGMGVLVGKLTERKVSLFSLVNELHDPQRVYAKAVELDALRQIGEEAIHDTIEVATLNMDGLSTTDIDDMHAAVRFNMYGHSGHNTRRLGYGLRYVIMASKHTRAKLGATEKSLEFTQAKLKPYLPDLAAPHE